MKVSPSSLPYIKHEFKVFYVVTTQYSEYQQCNVLPYFLCSLLAATSQLSVLSFYSIVIGNENHIGAVNSY
jgi:hypothetical protein